MRAATTAAPPRDDGEDCERATARGDMEGIARSCIIGAIERRRNELAS
jgi:hypothetical protein